MPISSATFEPIADFFRSMVQLVYPHTCAVCSEGLRGDEEVICTRCVYDLPRTYTCFTTDNIVAKHFWGRLPIEHACAFIHFAKGSRYQHLLHLLKYSGRRDIGVFLGQKLGMELAASSLYADVSAIVPVPLHPKKQLMRGYNQSQAIAEGIAQRTGWTVEQGVLLRTRFTQTQTKKTHQERQSNVADAFSVVQGECLAGQHVLIVDDVITTGATIEQCAKVLLQHCPNIRISIASLAYASGV